MFTIYLSYLALLLSWYCFLVRGEKDVTEVLARCGGSCRGLGSTAGVGAQVLSGVGRERREHPRAGWGCQTLAEAMENVVW